eukprot:CAMPEP_0194130402 /NCGR_PEP_ID=MMETSP0152-20130528/1447_1 /TAXON_ID=1049557 /ORGANISM="Thalassiothrix antarctica, Strain L6-D1" /LENGTH=639 /DNA_ID=CAMNT_0038824903 /DNA_START=35 /DNA_END=1954 /DNA_ORIENTATION=+
MKFSTVSVLSLTTIATQEYDVLSFVPASPLVSHSPELSTVFWPSPSGVCSSKHKASISISSTIDTVTERPSIDDFPEVGSNGLYQIENPEQHKTLLEAYPNKLVVIKVFAPWCKACKAVATKFIGISKDKKYDELPILWAEMTVSGNKSYIKELGILALPSIMFYAGSEGLVENFPCGPSKVPIFKRKLVQFINTYVDSKSRELKVLVQPSDMMMEETKPCAERSVVLSSSDTTEMTIGGIAVSKDVIESLKKIPYFKDFDEQTFTETIGKAKLKTWETGDIIMREGKKGRTFYMILSGEVEILVKTSFGDPMSMPANYAGTVVNRLSSNEYFGERALITAERRAATVRASEKTRCFAFDKDDIPASSVLSGKCQATTKRLEQVNDKYGVDVSDLGIIEVQKQLEESQLGSQVRGSVNSPEKIEGVDIPEKVKVGPHFTTSEDAIFSLLQRFRMIKYAARCFNYIIQTHPSWSEGGRRRRSMLVGRLTDAQRQEFQNVFKLIDKSGDNEISLNELQRVMESIGEEKSGEELEEVVTTGHTGVDGSQVMTYEDFMGIMSETEFFHLFKDTFASLDIHNSGFVKAYELDRILCGMRDLISDDRKSIIDIDDKEMMIDYEQFSRMLIGGSLAATQNEDALFP